jgi:hypothetical protein
MFHDEARFGRMVSPKRCWAPAPLRPVMGNGYEPEFVYVYVDTLSLDSAPPPL